MSAALREDGPVDPRAARTRHPDAVPLDAAVEIATVLMLLEEGLEWVEQGHATVVEHTLLDDLVRPLQQRLRDCEAERLGGLEVDDKLELRWLFDGKIGGLGALQDLIYGEQLCGDTRQPRPCNSSSARLPGSNQCHHGTRGSHTTAGTFTNDNAAETVRKGAAAYPQSMHLIPDIRCTRRLSVGASGASDDALRTARNMDG
jgi:hypothetical protein